MKKKAKTNVTVSPAKDVWYRLKKNKGAMFGLVVVLLVFLLAVCAPLIADYDTQVIGTNPAERLQPPSAEHIFGTDAAGRDLFYRIAYGARYSLTFGIGCTAIGALVGAIIGASAAFFGGKVDTVITFIVDAMMCIPGMLLSLCLVSVLGAGFTNLMIAIVVSATPGFARIIRSVVLGVVKQDYIEAARAIGVSSRRSIIAHVLPNAIGMIIVDAMMQVSGLIIEAAGLSFIGMGVQPPAPEWGVMLNDAITYLRSYPHTALFPGLAIIITALSFNLLGDGLSEALDPRMRD